MICAKACKNPTFTDQTVTFSGKTPALTNGPAKRLSDHQPASLMSALPRVTGQSLSDRIRFTESLLPLGEGVPPTLNSYRRWQLFRVEGKWVLRQIGNGLATKKPIGPCQTVARGTRNPLLTSPSSLLRLLPSTIVKQRCAWERAANPGKPICGATFSSWACRRTEPLTHHPEPVEGPRAPTIIILSPLLFILGLSPVRSRDIRSLFVSAGERIVRGKKGSHCSKE